MLKTSQKQTTDQTIISAPKSWKHKTDQFPFPASSSWKQTANQASTPAQSHRRQTTDQITTSALNSWKHLTDHFPSLLQELENGQQTRLYYPCPKTTRRITISASSSLVKTDNRPDYLATTPVQNSRRQTTPDYHPCFRQLKTDNRYIYICYHPLSKRAGSRKRNRWPSLLNWAHAIINDSSIRRLMSHEKSWPGIVRQRISTT